MTLPLSRNTTYAPGSQVKSADLNALQDMIIGRKTPDVVERLPGYAGHCTPVGGGGAFRSFFGDGSVSNTDGLGATLMVPIPLRVGDRLKSFRALVLTAAVASEISSTLRVVSVQPGVAPVSTDLFIANSAAVATMQELTGSFSPVTIGANDAVHFVVSAAATVGTKSVYAVEFVWDRP